MIKAPAHNGGRSLLEHVESLRRSASVKTDPSRRKELGQYPTPQSTAEFMASLFEANASSIRLLDAGAGVGSLAAAFVAEICARPSHPKDLTIAAFELDEDLATYLLDTLSFCEKECRAHKIGFKADLRREDFIDAAVSVLKAALFRREQFNCAILNPPG